LTRALLEKGYSEEDIRALSQNLWVKSEGKSLRRESEANVFGAGVLWAASPLRPPECQ
jgi:hypothetical protein